MARSYTISAIEDIAANGRASLIDGLRGRTLDEPSRVIIFATREAIDVLMTITIGGTEVLGGGLASIVAAVGTKPTVPDDIIVDSGGLRGEEIIVTGQNLTAGALELRVLIFVVPLSDVAMNTVLG